MKLIEEYYNKFPLLQGFSKSWKWTQDVNTAVPFYSPLYYIICKALGSKNIVEIGAEYGFSSYMLAMAANENGGLFLSVEKCKKLAKQLKEGLVEEKFPHIVICADSKDIKDFPWMEKIDFVLLDGEHSREAIEHEFELFYPKLTGVIALHDIKSVSADGFYSVLNNPKYNLECITFPFYYGLALFKKKEENYDEAWKNLALSMREKNKTFPWFRKEHEPQTPGKIEIL